MAQWIRHRSTEPEIVGSSPTRVSIHRIFVWLVLRDFYSYVCVSADLLKTAARLAQSVERQPFKLVVVGSSPTVGTFCELFCA